MVGMEKKTGKELANGVSRRMGMETGKGCVVNGVLKKMVGVGMEKETGKELANGVSRRMGIETGKGCVVNGVLKKMWDG